MDLHRRLRILISPLKQPWGFCLGILSRAGLDTIRGWGDQPIKVFFLSTTFILHQLVIKPREILCRLTPCAHFSPSLPHLVGFRLFRITPLHYIWLVSGNVAVHHYNDGRLEALTPAHPICCHGLRVLLELFSPEGVADNKCWFAETNSRSIVCHDFCEAFVSFFISEKWPRKYDNNRCDTPCGHVAGRLPCESFTRGVWLLFARFLAMIKIRYFPRHIYFHHPNHGMAFSLLLSMSHRVHICNVFFLRCLFVSRHRFFVPRSWSRAALFGYEAWCCWLKTRIDEKFSLFPTF